MSFQFPFLFFCSYLWLSRGLDIVGEDNIGLKLVPMRRRRVLRTRRARLCTLATLASPGLGKVLSQQRAEGWEESREGTWPILI